MLRAGVAANGADVINVVPPFAEAGLDIRMWPNLTTYSYNDLT
jgi:hypothetical protein